MKWRRKSAEDERDERLEAAQREVDDLQRRVKFLEAQATVLKRKLKREIARSS